MDPGIERMVIPMRKTKKTPLWYNPVEKEARAMRLEGLEVFDFRSYGPAVREELFLMPAYRSIYRKNP